MIYLRPAAGLCNRIRAISSCLVIAKQRGDVLSVQWGPDDGMDVSYEDLFIPPDEFCLIRADMGGSADQIFSEKNPYFRGRAFWYKDEKAADEFLRNYLSGDHDIAITTSKYLDFKRDYSWIRPRPEILNQVQDVRCRLGENCIGLHIRRTDNLYSRQYSALRLFEDVIRKEIQNVPNAKFFLATDDSVTKARLSMLFGDRIVTREDVPARFENGGAQSGFVDFLLLASTKKIYGSYWSSFSEEAACFGGVPRVTVKSQKPEIELSLLCSATEETSVSGFVNSETLECGSNDNMLEVVRTRARGMYVGRWADAQWIADAYGNAVLRDADVVVLEGRPILIKRDVFNGKNPWEICIVDMQDGGLNCGSHRI